MICQNDITRARRITRLIEEKLMTPRAAAVVVDAAMFGKGCIEGKVRKEIQRRLDRETQDSLESRPS